MIKDVSRQGVKSFLKKQWLNVLLQIYIIGMVFVQTINCYQAVHFEKSEIRLYADYFFFQILPAIFLPKIGCLDEFF